jgi:riboflavin kinase/FMN adenylyltransferase
MLNDAVITKLRSELEPHRRPCVATIGTFDGVHAGHRALVALAHHIARARRLALIVVTFSPRPDEVLRRDQALPSLCSLRERERRLREAGADDVVVVSFSRGLSSMTAQSFVTSLVRGLDVKALCVGEDFALGRGREGDVPGLRELGLTVVACPLVTGPDGAKVSSSALRSAAAHRADSARKESLAAACIGAVPKSLRLARSASARSSMSKPPP